jgi:hypothetical protein
MKMKKAESFPTLPFQSENPQALSGQFMRRLT